MHVENGFDGHAGLLPGWTVARRGIWRGRWRGAGRALPLELLHHMWGSEPSAWRDDLRDHERMRVIVNAMTRMRFCTADGVMDFKVKVRCPVRPGLHALVRRCRGPQGMPIPR